MTREKKIITDELISEHKRAESLAKAIENITKTFKEIDVIAKKTGADAETDSVAKLRLSKDVTDMMAKRYGLKKLKQKHTNWIQIQRFSVALVVNDFL